MRLSADWMRAPGATALLSALDAAGAQAYFVGGCVRDGLLGRPVEDIDIATDALPQKVTEAVEAAGLRAVPTGIDHGTVTVVAEGRPYEVTTFRQDLETDGRHATVGFSTDIATDAARRDLTINALYADASGAVLDPNGDGLADLQTRAVRFIGDAADRIQEDYLRILRFFRFHAWYADPMGGLDPEGMAAIAEHGGGLGQISKERIGSEMKKLLAAPDPAPAVAAMQATGVLARVLPGAVGDLMFVLTELDKDMPANPMRRLAALGGEDVADALRLSGAEAKRLDQIKDVAGSADAPAALGYRYGETVAKDALILRAAMTQMPVGDEGFAEVLRGAKAVFPVAAADLMPGFEGPALGARLRLLEERWIASDFSLDRQALLNNG